MQEILVSELNPHSKNDYFFDDMSGDKWDEFVESVRTSGVIEPIVITQDKVIVSGHQRVRACKELGITSINAEVRIYDDDDAIIKDLLETNVRQRGDIGGSTVKLGRRIKELERIYGIRQGSAGGTGSNQYASSAIGTSSKIQFTEEELATRLGIGLDTLKRAKILVSLPQEIQDLVEAGNISPSTASRLIARLSPEEQEQLAASLPATEKLTQKQVQQYIRDISDRDVQIGEQANELVHLRQKNQELQLNLDKAQKTETITVYPDDYDKTKRENKERARDYDILNKEYQKRCQELRDLKEKMRGYEEKSPEKQFDEQLKDDTIFFCAKVSNFLKAVGGYAYLTEHIDGLPQEQRNGYIKAISSVGAWAQNILDCVNKGVIAYE